MVTVDPKYATYPRRDESLVSAVPDGMEVVRTKSVEPLQWYGKFAGKDRIPYGGFSNEKQVSWLSKFVRGNFFIPDARRGWNRHALKAARMLIREHSIELVLTTGPPHSTHLIGLELQARFGVKWIADMRDPWTDVYYNFDMPRSALAKRYDRMLELRVLRGADAVITASPGFARQFAERHQRPYHVVTNGYDAPLAHVKRPEDEPPYITYTGTVAASYRPEGLIRALAGMKHMPFRLRVAGSLSAEVLEQIKAAGLDDRFDFLGYLPHDEIAAELCNATVLLLMSPAVRGGRDIIPGKLFEYLAARKPILAVGERESEVGKILKETDAGRSFDHSDAEGMTAFLTECLRGEREMMPGEPAERFSRKALSKKIVEVFEHTVRSKD